MSPAAAQVLTDSHGIRFVREPWEEPIEALLVDRSCDDATFAAFEQILRPGDTVLDVGAHVGRYAVCAGRLVGSAGRVLALEPVSASYWQLKTTVALNRLETIECYRLAAGDRRGRAAIHVYDQPFSSWSSLIPHAMTGPQGEEQWPVNQEEVEVVTLDEFAAQHSVAKIKLLKIDVEGMEALVLRGAAELLRSRSIDVVCFEISAAPMAATRYTPADLVAMFEGNGYGVCRFDLPSRKFVPVSVPEMQVYHDNFYAMSESRVG